MGSIHRRRAHCTYRLLYKPLLFHRASKWIQVLGLGAAGNHPQPAPSWGFASPALHGPSQQPRCSGLSSFLCPEPRVPPEHTSAFAGSLGSLYAPAGTPPPPYSRLPHWSHHAQLPPAQADLQDTPLPLRATRQGWNSKGRPEATQAHHLPTGSQDW